MPKKQTSAPPLSRMIKKLLTKLNHIGGWLANGVVTIYQYTISPDKGILSPILKGRVCAHEPHCSAYGKECLKRYGLFPGVSYTTERVFSCKPSNEKTYDPSHYRVVFFSGSPIGVPFLEQLAKDPRYEIVWVVTMPDKPADRGQQLKKNIIKTTATKLGIQNIYTPATLKQTNKDIAFGDIAASLQSLQADWFFVIAYGKIIPQHILDIPIFWSINVHGSLLPALRGASPLQSVFLTEEKPEFQTGFTVMHLNDKMDEGDIISTYSFPVAFERTSEDLFKKVEEKGPKHLANTIREYSKWHIDALPQEHENATYCTKITKEDAQIDLFTTPLSELYAKYRAYKIRPKIWTTRNDKKILIEWLSCDKELFSQHAWEPLLKQGDKIPTLNPAVTELLLKPEGKKQMTRKDFANGYMR